MKGQVTDTVLKFVDERVLELVAFAKTLLHQLRHRASEAAEENDELELLWSSAKAA